MYTSFSGMIISDQSRTARQIKLIELFQNGAIVDFLVAALGAKMPNSPRTAGAHLDGLEFARSISATTNQMKIVNQLQRIK